MSKFSSIVCIFVNQVIILFVVFSEAKEDLKKLRSKHSLCEDTESGIAGAEEDRKEEEEESRKEWRQMVEDEWSLVHTLDSNYQTTSKQQFGGVFDSNNTDEEGRYGEEHVREEVAIRAPISVFATRYQRKEDNICLYYETRSYAKKSLPLQEYIVSIYTYLYIY